MKPVYKILILSVTFLSFSACSSEDSDDSNATKGHVWKGQTDQIDKAKEVESIMQDAARQNEATIDQQIQ